jgi:hypothetical protein
MAGAGSARRHAQLKMGSDPVFLLFSATADPSV